MTSAARTLPSYRVSSFNGAATVRASGSIVFENWREMRDAFAIARTGSRRIALSVREAEYIDSFGIASILINMERTHAEGIAVFLEGCGERLAALFSITGICGLCGSDGLRCTGRWARA